MAESGRTVYTGKRGTKDTKMGLNLAIKENEKIVGVVGMTGRSGIWNRYDTAKAYDGGWNT